MNILQIVGFKNSGKTTLMLELIRLAQENGKTVATVKHHGHSSALEMPSAQTDSTRFFEGGAQASIVYGAGVIQQHVRKKEAALEDLLYMAAKTETDFIFVEGFKDAPYEKIVLIRSERDWIELKSLKEIALVMKQEDVNLNDDAAIDRNDKAQIEAWFAAWMEGNSK